MMNRASQEWPDEYTVEIPEPEPTGQNTGTLITDLTNVVERAEKESHEKHQSSRVQIEMSTLQANLLCGRSLPFLSD